MSLSKVKSIGMAAQMHRCPYLLRGEPSLKLSELCKQREELAISLEEGMQTGRGCVLGVDEVKKWRPSRDGSMISRVHSIGREEGQAI